ncbi:Copper chaperone for superoxide dismutase, chloroplastic/cytosolic [Sesamum angolense]|uniref:Superoxide dismutase copper chaperone n=1 Tax=Sesamum angolense TaxID=2727404 RepID=A0AAE1W9T5_9LAMI|nr:Copper chaperone for superoxide dismutase, chloroplastic/cytosolic [Sesamum angolense]
MAFLRSVVTTKTTAIAATIAIPTAFAVSSVYPSPSTSHSSAPFQRVFKNLGFGSLSCSSNPIRGLEKSGLVKSFASPASAAVEMDQKPPAQNGAVLPELLGGMEGCYFGGDGRPGTEFMVDMKCEGCVNSVKNKLQTLDGVKNVDVDLANQVVRVLGTSPVKILTEALEQTGRKARLIGQGVPDDFLVSAAVAEFKGPAIFGVVRLAQVNMELARIEANFSGLPPGKHGWSINEFGDLTSGAASTGKVFNPTNDEKEPLGDLGTLEADEKGEAFFSGVKEKLRVGDLIGRSIVVYGTEDKSDEGITAAVVARSAGVGENYKKLCTCDGTTIWEATNADFVTSKV